MRPLRLGLAAAFSILVINSCTSEPEKPLGVAGTQAASPITLQAASGAPTLSLNQPPEYTNSPDGPYDLLPGNNTCITYSVTVTDANGLQVQNPSVTWSVGDSRVLKIFDGSGLHASPYTTTNFFVSICGQIPDASHGYGYSKFTVTWTTDSRATTTRLMEYGQTANGYQPQSVSVIPSDGSGSFSLNPGQNKQMKSLGLDPWGNTRTKPTSAWSVDLPSIATVDISGLVHGVSKGNAVVTANVLGTNGSATIYVLGVFSISVSLSPSSICLGGGSTATATAYDQLHGVWGGGTMSWSSSATAIATVVQSGTRQGNVTSHVEGQATITATLEDKSGSAVATVVYCAPQAFAFGPYTLNLYQSGTYTASVNGGAPPFTYQFRRQDCPVSDFSCGAWGIWYSTGSTSTWNTTVYSCGIQHIYVESRVTDARGNTSPASGPWKTYINNPC